MTKLTPDQINRGLSLAESVLSLVTDVWSHRKASAKRPRKPKKASN